MTAIDKIRAKFWAQLPARSTRLSALLVDARRGHADAFEGFSSLIHAAKGEAQLLGLEPCAGLLELADELVKMERTVPFSSLGDEAFAILTAALEELAATPHGGELTAKAMASMGRALDATDRAAS